MVFNELRALIISLRFTKLVSLFSSWEITFTFLEFRAKLLFIKSLVILVMLLGKYLYSLLIRRIPEEL